MSEGHAYRNVLGWNRGPASGQMQGIKFVEEARVSTIRYYSDHHELINPRHILREQAVYLGCNGLAMGLGCRSSRTAFRMKCRRARPILLLLIFILILTLLLLPYQIMMWHMLPTNARAHFCDLCRLTPKEIQ